MKLKNLFLLTLIILLIVGCTKVENNNASEKEFIKIGVILPLSGSLTFMGNGARNSVNLALEQLENTKYEYKVIFEDDRMEPQLTSTATNKLINIDNVDAIVSFSSGSGNVVSPVTNLNKIIHIGIGSDVTIAKGNYNFIHWTQPNEENRVFVQELIEKDIKKIAIFEINQQGTTAIVADLKPKLEEANIEIVSDQKFNFGEKDFKTLISKAKKSKPDIYLLLALSPELEILTKQIKEQGIDKPLTAIEAFEFSEEPELFEGMWYVQAADPSAEYVDSYKAKFENNPVVGSPNTYDAINLIVKAFEKAETKEEAVNELSEIQGFKGALGTLNIGETGVINSTAIIRTIKNGEFVTISN